MASSRRTGTNEQISVLGTDYSTLALWESGTDNNLSGDPTPYSEVLECPAGEYDQNVNIAGSTTDSSYFRIIRAQEAAKHGGIFGSGVHFKSTATANIISSNEDYFNLQDVEVSFNVNSFSSFFAYEMKGDEDKVVACITLDSTNIGSGNVTDFKAANSNTHYFINCASVNSEVDGFQLNVAPTFLYNCIAVNAGRKGLWEYSTSIAKVKNCLITGSVIADFDITDVSAVEEYNASGDGTASGTGSRINQTFTFVDAVNDNYHLSDSDVGALGFGTDLSSDTNFAFDDDIDGNTIVSWSIGFDSDPVSSGATGSATDTIVLTESSTPSVNYSVSDSDTVSLTESSVVNSNYPVSALDTVALSESSSTSAALIESSTDTLSLLESSVGTLVLLASASDTVSLSESSTCDGMWTATASDTISLTESSLTDSALSGTATDSIALTDACVGEASYNPVSTDTIALTDSAEGVSAALGSSRRTGVNEQISVLGTDYATIALWESGTQDNLVTAAKSEVLECPAGTYAGEVTLAGATTNASYFRIIRPVTGAEHHGDPTAGVFIEMTSTFAIRLNENYACLHDVNCTVNIDSATTKQAVYPTADNIAVTNCMVIDPVNISGGATHSFGSTGSCDDTSFINCLAVGAISVGFRLSGTGSNLVAYNCASIDAGDDGFFSGDTTFRFINCLSTGSAALDFDFGTAPAVSDYLSSGDTTADDNGGTGNRISQTFTFVDALNDDYHLSSSDGGAKGFGTDLSSDPNFAFNDDIDGTVITTWSIGFDSDPVVAASLTDTISVTESSSGLSVLLGSASDTVALTDTNTGVAAFEATQSESIALTETSVSTLVFLATRSDSVALTESALGMLIVLASLADTVSLTESSSATSNLSASASDTVSLTDSNSVVSAFNAGLSDTLTLTESSLSALVLLASRSDSVVLTDQSLGVLVILASASDTVALSESGLSTGVFTGLSSDTLALVESSIGNSVSDASFSDTINLTELGSVPTDFPVSLSDVLTITETSNGVLTRLVSLIDVIPEDFALYAEQSGLGTVNTNLFRGGLLAKPDAQVCFTLSAGPAPERVLDGRNVVDMPTLRVLVRGAPGDRKGAATTATRVYEMFDGLTGKTIGSNKYQTVFATSPPAPFAIDESGRRPVYSVDFELRIARV